MSFVSCPNALFCGSKNISADSILFGLCPLCVTIFSKLVGGRGKADIKDNIECPICLQTKMGITQAKCKHYLCFDCFRRCQYGDESFDKENEPIFPYDEEIESKYYNDLENPGFQLSEENHDLETHKLIESKYEVIRQKWYIQYPLIKEYNKKKIEWDDKQFENSNSVEEENLRYCPICRQ